MSFSESPLVDVLDFFNGKAPPKTQGGAYPVFGSNGQIGWSDKFNHEQAVIIGRVGAYCGSIEVCRGKFWASDNTIVVKPKQDNDLNYLYYKLGSMPLRGYAGGAAQPLLTQGVLKSVKSLFADPETQVEISQILKKYDDLIENNKRRIELLEESARQLYKEWFVRFRFPGHEHVKIIDGVPDGWNKGCVSDLGQVITGKTPSTKVKENFGGDIPFIKTPDMHASSIIFEPEEYLSDRGANTQANKYLPKFSILVACIGARLGVVSLNARRCQTNQQINAIIPRSEMYTFYSYLTLKGFREKLLAIGGGATMPNVNKSKFSGMEVLIPPESFLESFRDVVAQPFSQMEKLIEMNSKLTQARDLLLPKLMNGEIAV
ncbi:MAG: restriction endonuclease subunit S [Candidatus Thiodiazotropha sp. 6PLUC6]